jgi:hypothetical protein
MRLFLLSRREGLALTSGSKGMPSRDVQLMDKDTSDERSRDVSNERMLGSAAWDCASNKRKGSGPPKVMKMISRRFKMLV